MATNFAFAVAFAVCVTYAVAEAARKPIPSSTRLNLTIGSEFTFECQTRDFPQIWFYLADYIPLSSAKKECLGPKLEGCWAQMVITHQCGGRQEPCKLKVAAPQKAAGCTVDYYLSVMWQCTLPRLAGNTRTKFGEPPQSEDPACAKYYSRED